MIRISFPTESGFCLSISEQQGADLSERRLQEKRIAVEIKEFRSRSPVLDLEQAIGQYVLYSLLLGKVDPEREIWLAVTDRIYDDIFSEPLGELVVRELPLRLILINTEKAEVVKWITPQITGIL